MYRRWFLPLSLLVLAVAAGYWGYGQQQENRRLKVTIDNNYQRAFYDLSDHVQNAEVLLGKSLVSADPLQNQRLYEQVWDQANLSLVSLAQLPAEDGLLARTAKFITQLGDYARVMSDQSALGKNATNEQWQTLNRLYNQASSLNSELGKIDAVAAESRFSSAALAVSGVRQAQADAGRARTGGNFQAVDRQMQKYPTLIYDGPFSDHLDSGKARGISGNHISRARAERVALQYFAAVEPKDVVARVASSVGGNIPAYRVEITGRARSRGTGETVVADVTKQGGRLLWLLDQRDVGGAKLSLAEASQRAMAYLKKQGYSSMKESYHQLNGNRVLFNFAWMQDGVVIYPDLVKVTVALDNGGIVAVDTRSYLMSHWHRELPRPQWSVKQALARVSDKLTVTTPGRLALIPVGAGQEQLTWEFKGSLAGDVYLVYISAMDGREVNLLRLIENKDGALTL
ncbi:MAG: germination protein YpeB [Firmicutes bacterium]|nr:germination protein YpeB [Bacillota bacterium]